MSRRTPELPDLTHRERLLPSQARRAEKLHCQIPAAAINQLTGAHA